MKELLVLCTMSFIDHEPDPECSCNVFHWFQRHCLHKQGLPEHERGFQGWLPIAIYISFWVFLFGLYFPFYPAFPFLLFSYVLERNWQNQSCFSPPSPWLVQLEYNLYKIIVGGDTEKHLLVKGIWKIQLFVHNELLPFFLSFSKLQRQAVNLVGRQEMWVVSSLQGFALFLAFLQYRYCKCLHMLPCPPWWWPKHVAKRMAEKSVSLKLIWKLQMVIGLVGDWSSPHQYFLCSILCYGVI